MLNKETTTLSRTLGVLPGEKKAMSELPELQELEFVVFKKMLLTQSYE